MDLGHKGASSKPTSTNHPILKANAWYRPADAGSQKILKTNIDHHYEENDNEDIVNEDIDNEDIDNEDNDNEDNDNEDND